MGAIANEPVPRRRRRWLRVAAALLAVCVGGWVALDLWSRHRLGAAHAQWAASGAPTRFAALDWPV
ncbi:MAG TPA: hypothetical protein VJP77_04065, partial [Planctomycetota bacterium]|nr:hypothetical protein [Planctomycetota bacterium]